MDKNDKFHVYKKFNSQVPDFGPILTFGPEWSHDLGQKITFDIKSRSFLIFSSKKTPSDGNFHAFNKFGSQVPDFGPILPFGPKWRHDLGQKITFDVKSRSFLIFLSKIILRWKVSCIQ